MQRDETILLQGGLDLVSQPMLVKPGYCIAAQNYESEVRGYRRSEGYERFDGQPAPSGASYWVLDFDTGSTAISEGDIITGATSGATGIVLQDASVSSGSYGGGDAAGEIILFDVTGTFLDSENLEVSASPVAVADGTALELDEADQATSDGYVQAAIEKRRDRIAAVPGSGALLGVWSYMGAKYAFRNNAGGTAAVMFKSTSAGWVAQSLGHTLDFTGGGTTRFVEGETITGGTSGATATVERVILQSGDWSLSSAAGYLVLSGITGTFQAAETITGGTSGATAAPTGPQAAITLPAGGKYRFIVTNFYGVSNLRRLYGVNGVGYAFEWDGTVFAPIRTGVETSLDKPKFIGVHNNHLLLGYDGGALLNSGTGLPLSFLSTDGAAQFGLGQDITGIKSSTKTSTVITGRNKIGYLTGANPSDFVLQDISEDSGAITDTLEVIGEPHFLDDRGIRSLSASQNFGDWSMGTITEKVETLFKSKRASGVVPVGAIRVRGKDQYRLFWNDGSGISIYFGRKKPETMSFLLRFTPTCVASSEDADGNEILLAGDDEGFVYQIDSGTSADGETVEAFIRFPFLHQGAPNQEKRYHRAKIDVAEGGGNSLYYISDYGYGDPDLNSSPETAISFFGGGGFWDVSFWDQFFWDAMVQSHAWADLDGIGVNVSIVLMSDAIYEDPHTLASMTIFYTPRRRLR